jgi:tetratricopeptide (TPR) repeat protein
MTDVKQGRIDTAKASLAEMKPLLANINPVNQAHFAFLYDCFQGELLLAEGSVDKAVAEYERLITFDPKKEQRTLIHPLYYYRLAKLYEQKGLKAKAVERYKRFLNLWKDADPALSEVEEAKRRLVGL